MYKIFTLALAISVLPVSRQFYSPTVDVAAESKAYIYPYKNTITTNFFEPEKKVAAEPWSQNWMATAQENIRKSEYNFVWEEKLKAYCTPNRKKQSPFFLYR